MGFGVWGLGFEVWGLGLAESHHTARLKGSVSTSRPFKLHDDDDDDDDDGGGGGGS